MGRRGTILSGYVATLLGWLWLLGLVVFTVLFVAGVVTLNVVQSISCFVFAWVCGYWVFKDTLGLVQGVGPLYWLVKPSSFTKWFVTLGTMSETDFPWRYGKGIALFIPYREIHLGVCRRRKVSTEDEGILQAVGGHYLMADADEIGDW